MSESIEFTVTYSEGEFVRGMMHARGRAESSWLAFILSVVSVLIGFGLVYWFAIRERGPIGSNDAVVASVALVLSIPLAVALQKFKPSDEMYFARLFRRNPIFQAEFTVKIDETGIDSKSSSFENRVGWNVFLKAFESDDDFFFLLSDDQPIYFPKRVFSPPQMISLRRIASEHLGAKAKFSY